MKEDIDAAHRLPVKIRPGAPPLTPEVVNRVIEQPREERIVARDLKNTV